MNEQLIDYEKAKGREVLRILTGYLKLELCGKRILEIGCSTGALIELLEQQGADVLGMDIESTWSKTYYYKPNKRIMCNLEKDRIPEKAAPGAFDLVIAQEVIEHIKAPYEFLSKVWKLLRTGGKLFLTTPNLNGLTALVKGGRWCGISTEGHVLLYSKKSLNLLLCNCGFVPIKAFTNCIPIAYQNGFKLLWLLNKTFMWTSIGGGITALYEKPSTTQ